MYHSQCSESKKRRRLPGTYYYCCILYAIPACDHSTIMTIAQELQHARLRLIYCTYYTYCSNYTDWHDGHAASTQYLRLRPTYCTYCTYCSNYIDWHYDPPCNKYKVRATTTTISQLRPTTYEHDGHAIPTVVRTNTTTYCSRPRLTTPEHHGHGEACVPKTYPKAIPAREKYQISTITSAYSQGGGVLLYVNASLQVKNRATA